MKGFGKGSGSTNSCLVELWALSDGLNLTSDLEILHLIIKMDAQSIVQLMKNSAPKF